MKSIRENLLKRASKEVLYNLKKKGIKDHCDMFLLDSCIDGIDETTDLCDDILCWDISLKYLQHKYPYESW